MEQNNKAEEKTESTEKVITTRGLTKFYGKKRGVEDVSIEVNKGEIFGFLGPNGAGKTTTINLLLNLIRPSSGDADVFGMNIKKHGKKIRRRIGFIPGEPGFYEDMRGREYLRFLAGLRGVKCDKRINELGEYFFNIELHRKIKGYSRGMKQLLGIIQAFMASPDLYILDEPTANLDPLMNHRFYSLMMEEYRKGKTIFLSSHMLSEVERLCQRVCIVKKGKIVRMDTVENLRRQMKEFIEVAFEEEVELDSLMVEGVKQVSKEDGFYRIEVSGKVNEILKRVSEVPVKSFNYRKMSLEEIFHEHFADTD